MFEEITFDKALKIAEKKLSKELGMKCVVEVYFTVNNDILNAIKRITDLKFREELRYDYEEILNYSKMSGFLLILIKSGNEPVGMLFGYKYEEGGYFLDVLASIIEGKGVGRTLITLLIVYCYEKGHSLLTLFTEEVDEKGRQLRRYYEKMGFRYLYTGVGKGDVMEINFDANKVKQLVNRYL